VLLYGPPGTGKTTAATTSDAVSLTLTEDTSVQELIGHYVPKGSEFAWHDGPATTAWRQGRRLVLNEVDKAAGSVLTALLALLDDVSIARLTLPTGETIRPLLTYTVVATSNIETPEELPEPLRDRFDASILIDTPHPVAIAKLPQDLQQVCVNAYRSRDSKISYRKLLSYSKIRELVGAEDAAKAVFGRDYQDVLAALKLGART